MNVVLKDDFNLSENESEYFSGTDDDSGASFGEVSDSLYEGDAESNSFDEDTNSESSIYEQSANYVIGDIFFELKSDIDSDESNIEIYKESGSDDEIVIEDLREFIEDTENDGTVWKKFWFTWL